MQRGRRITGKVKSIVKGGLVVNVGVEAFLPASQIDVITPKNLAQFVGNSYEFKVVKINQERQNIVLSRRELIEQERNEKRAKLLAEMVPGDIRKGTVKNITDFGAFIDLNGIDGLLHITDMSWGRIGHPSELLKVGQEIDVVVLDVNKEKERVSLGLKQKMANPWDNIETKFPVGARVKGKVVSLVPYGAFVQLEPGVEGLVHVTELSWTKRVAKPSDILKQDQEIEAVVLGINREEHEISLGIRQLERIRGTPLMVAERKVRPQRAGGPHAAAGERQSSIFEVVPGGILIQSAAAEAEAEAAAAEWSGPEWLGMKLAEEPAQVETGTQEERVESPRRPRLRTLRLSTGGCWRRWWMAR